VSEKRRANGTGTVHDGYIRYNVGGKLVREHQLIAERALGKSLPAGAHVHHVDGNRKNNAHSNLVVCPSDAYHKLLHLRQDAIDACGNASFRKCQFCHQWDDPTRMRLNNRMYHHAECRAADNKRRWAARKAAK
jgi:hypothetical protein